MHHGALADADQEGGHSKQQQRVSDGGDVEANTDLGVDEQGHDAEHKNHDADAGGGLLRVVAGARHVMAGASVSKGLGCDGNKRTEQNIGHGCEQLVLHNFLPLPCYQGFVSTTSALWPQCDEEHKSCFL